MGFMWGNRGNACVEGEFPRRKCKNWVEEEKSRIAVEQYDAVYDLVDLVEINFVENKFSFVINLKINKRIFF